jgi:hypothetical protein
MKMRGNSFQTDNPMIGKGIRLIFTDDRYTRLKSGDMGTVTDVTKLPKELGGNRQIWVDGTQDQTLP